MLKDEIVVSKLLRLSYVELAEALGLSHPELSEDIIKSELVLVWLIVRVVAVETMVLDSADTTVVTAMFPEEERAVDVCSKLLVIVSADLVEEISVVEAEVVVCIVAEVVDISSG